MMRAVTSNRLELIPCYRAGQTSLLRSIGSDWANKPAGRGAGGGTAAQAGVGPARVRINRDG